MCLESSDQCIDLWIYGLFFFFILFSDFFACLFFHPYIDLYNIEII